MTDFLNWNDTWILVEHNWIWLLLALLIGVWVGWSTCDTSKG